MFLTQKKKGVGGGLLGKQGKTRGEKGRKKHIKKEGTSPLKRGANTEITVGWGGGSPYVGLAHASYVGGCYFITFPPVKGERRF